MLIGDTSFTLSVGIPGSSPQALGEFRGLVAAALAGAVPGLRPTRVLCSVSGSVWV